MNISKDLTVEKAIDDLDTYVTKKEFHLSDEALFLFKATEEIGFSYNSDLYPWVFLASLIINDKEFKSFLLRNECDIDSAYAACISEIADKDDDKYADNLPPYSSVERFGNRQLMIDACMSSAQSKNSREITREDFIIAFFNVHNESFPPDDNDMWTDERLNVPYNTLCHISGNYDRNLWITFQKIQNDLSIGSLHETRKGLVESAPRYIRSALLDFFSDYPHYQRNCFLIIPFRESKFHQEIRSCITKTLNDLNLNVLRADDHTLTFR